MLTAIMRTLAAATMVACMVALAAPSPAFAWPDKPIRIIIGFQAGGSGDVAARLLAEKLRPQLDNIQIVIDNKPGDSGAVGVAAMMAAKDGHTFMLMGEDVLTLSLLSKTATFQPLRDFKMVSSLVDGTMLILAGPAAPFDTFDGFVAYARANPGKINYVSAGTGSVLHMVGELISSTLKIEIKHVNSRGAGGAANDLVDGVYPMAIMGVSAALPHIRAGRIKALAVTTPTRMSSLPSVPTLSEAGLTGMSIVQHGGIVAPKSTPDAVVEQFSAAIRAALTDEGLRKRFEDLGATVRGSTPAQYTQVVEGLAVKWQKLIDERGLKID
jgi:tripartite-type tricarboxylate transporter receptor subunit TctC